MNTPSVQQGQRPGAKMLSKHVESQPPPKKLQGNGAGKGASQTTGTAGWRMIRRTIVMRNSHKNTGANPFRIGETSTLSAFP